MATRDLERLQRIAGRGLDRLEAAVEREILQVYNNVLESIRKEMMDVYDKYSVAGELTRAEMTKYNRLSALEKRLNTIVGQGTQKTRAAIGRLTRGAYNESYFRHAWAIEQHIGVGLNWGVLRAEDVVAAVANPLREIAEDRLRTLGRERIRRVVAEGITRGDSLPKMSRDLRTAIVAKGRESLAYNAMRVARTEAGRARTLGQLATYEKAEEQGVRMTEIWQATLDDRTRDSHGDMDGKEKQEQGFWMPSIASWVEGPRLTGVPEEDINCRCRVVAQVDGLPEPILRRTRDEGIVPYQTYDEWSVGR